MTEFKLPSLGEGVESGTVAGILVSVGEEVEEGQPLLELETGKSVVPVPAPQAGKIGAISVKEGDEVKVGQAVMSFEGAGRDAEPKAESKAEPKPAAKVDEVADQQEDTKVAAPAKLAESNGSPNGSANGVSHPLPAVAAASGVSGGSIAAAPSVRRLARELGVDLASVKGSGPNGRLGFADVKNAVAKVAAPLGYSNGVPAAPLPDFAKWGNVERKALSGIRRATAEQMARSWSTIPHVTQFDKADITELEKLRKQYGKQAEAAGAKLTVTAIILKVVAGALKKFPQFNSSLDLGSNEQVFKNYYNIGVAVDTPRGLMVPIVRDADKLNIVEIAVELSKIAERARDKKTTLEEMQGGTFTITNLGGIGGTAFTPIVNAPEVAILGLSRGGYEPFWNGQAFEPRMMLPLSLSYDHRVIDGADGARFLRWICNALEQPFLMSLEG